RDRGPRDPCDLPRAALCRARESSAAPGARARRGELLKFDGASERLREMARVWAEGGRAMRFASLPGKRGALVESLLQRLCGGFAGVELALEDEAGDDAGLDTGDAAGAGAHEDHFFGQAVEQVERRRTSVRKAGRIDGGRLEIAEGG